MGTFSIKNIKVKLNIEKTSIIVSQQLFGALFSLFVISQKNLKEIFFDNKSNNWIGLW